MPQPLGHPRAMNQHRKLKIADRLHAALVEVGAMKETLRKAHSLGEAETIDMFNRARAASEALERASELLHHIEPD